MFRCLLVRIVGLSERNFSCMFFFGFIIDEVHLLVFIDEFFVAFSISTWVGLSVVADFSSNLFALVKFAVFTVVFGLYFIVLNILNFCLCKISFVVFSPTLIVFCISANHLSLVVTLGLLQFL